MKALTSPKPFVIAIVVVLVLLLAVLISNFLLIKFRGSPVAVPDIPRGVENYGQGTALTYVVFGDSTTVAQGTDYDKGYVRATARHLADQGYAVQLYNFGISGARAADVPIDQIPRLIEQQIKPDVVLIAVTANDVTHLTSISGIKTSLSRSIEELRTINPDVRIVLTGSPQMGTISRFPQPTKYFARLRSNQVNKMVIQLVAEQKVTFAPIAEKTGPLFAAHPEYYAADLFHPNAEGYATWTPVLTDALDSALTQR